MSTMVSAFPLPSSLFVVLAFRFLLTTNAYWPAIVMFEPPISVENTIGFALALVSRATNPC